MQETIIRQAVLADVGAIAPLFAGYRQFYGQPRDIPAAAAFLRDRFDHGESIVLLSSVQEVPVGFTQLYPCFSSVSLARTLILNDLFVLESHRKTGVGSGLLTAAVAYARATGAVRLTLTTDIHNTSAQSLYESTGWKRDREFFVYHFSPISRDSTLADS